MTPAFEPVDLRQPGQLQLAIRIGIAWIEMRRGASAAKLRDHLYSNGTDTLEHWLRRTEVTWEQIVAMHPEVQSLDTPSDAREQVILEAKYSGYIGRQAAQVERFQKRLERSARL